MDSINNSKYDKYVKAIDTKNINEIELLSQNNDNKKKDDEEEKKNFNNKIIKKEDIVLEIYHNKLLTSQRLEIIIKHFDNYLYISNELIKELIKDDSISLLNIVFTYYRFYDNKLIINILLYHYKNKNPLATNDLKQLVLDEKYKISTIQISEEENDLENQKDKFNSNLFLNQACQEGKEFIVKFLLKMGTNIEKTSGQEGHTPLYCACSGGHESIVRYLIENGADVKNYDTIRVACLNNHETIVKCLVENGATGIPFCEALRNRNLQIIKILLSIFIESDIELDVEFLVEACRYDDADITIVKYLLENHKININGCEDFGRKTPLMEACSCSCGNKDIVKYLIENGADVNGTNKHEETPLMMACSHGNEELVKYLIENGADVNKADKDGETPLMEACLCGDDELVKYLVENGADVNITDNHGKTALIYARDSKIIHEEIIEYLLEEGADNAINYGIPY